MATRPKKDRAKGPGRPLFVKEWFEFLGKSDEQIAAIVGVARETVFRWHTEQDRLTPRKLGLLALAIGIQPEDFWRRPGRRSVDAILKHASDAEHEAVHDFVSKIVSRNNH